MHPYKPAVPGILAVLLGAALPSHALEIKLDYTYDTNGFFNQPGAKAALRAAADFYQTVLHDNLSRIDKSEWPAGNSWTAVIVHPGTGVQTNIPNLVVPADTIIVYAGGRPLGGAAGYGGPGGYSLSGSSGWANLVNSRGQAGALASPKTDFGPWGGMITFDNTLDWNFSTTTNDEDLSPFISIALHELGHLLGIGTAPSWQAKVSGGVFTGTNSTATYGSNVPLESGGYHWRDDATCEYPDGYDPTNPDNILSKAYGSFGAPHGFAQIALMDPGLCSVGQYHKAMTDLDLAALKDIGWQMAPPLKWIAANVKPKTGPVNFTWATTSTFTYRLERSTTLAAGGWTTLVTRTGNGTIQNYTDATPPTGKAFYRLNTNPAVPPAMLTPVAAGPAPTEVAPQEVDSCTRTIHCCQ
ncbi:hypothetical protein KBB96_19315 [Luteolibacter ambystomatis]|uniref:Peptidase M10 metallopeptidase domain-containing protein n=1 Tax=Luteolibacter ambystomatis TaxID=2824561 RepID=A0A975G8X7_9BACT|nr:hypothetical protein [Luteolibacter ambystomatis]QUE50992.1 hypothetical protein KBB96_19315 [Luteolibacter ambystomatis]